MGRSDLRIKDNCKRDMKLDDVDTNTWEWITDVVRGGVGKVEGVRRNHMAALTKNNIQIQFKYH